MFFFESGSILEHRIAVLSELQQIASNIGTRILVSDSAQFNIPGLDIDAVCVTSQNITRQIFFERFPEELKSFKCPELEKIQIIQCCGVPYIVEVLFAGLTFRLSHASFKFDELPKDIDSNHARETTDKNSYWSLMSCKEMEIIHRNFPSIEFEECGLNLRCVKVWAKRKTSQIFLINFRYNVPIAISRTWNILATTLLFRLANLGF